MAFISLKLKTPCIYGDLLPKRSILDAHLFNTYFILSKKYSELTEIFESKISSSILIKTWKNWFADFFFMIPKDSKLGSKDSKLKLASFHLDTSLS